MCAALSMGENARNVLYNKMVIRDRHVTFADDKTLGNNVWLQQNSPEHVALNVLT